MGRLDIGIFKTCEIRANSYMLAIFFLNKICLNDNIFFNDDLFDRKYSIMVAEVAASWHSGWD